MSTISNAMSLAYELGSSQGSLTNEIKRLTRTKKRKKKLLAELIRADPKGSGEISEAEFH
jgi:hypothetical protein